MCHSNFSLVNIRMRRLGRKKCARNKPWRARKVSNSSLNGRYKKLSYVSRHQAGRAIHARHVVFLGLAAHLSALGSEQKRGTGTGWYPTIDSLSFPRRIMTLQLHSTPEKRCRCLWQLAHNVKTRLLRRNQGILPPPHTSSAGFISPFPQSCMKPLQQRSANPRPIVWLLAREACNETYSKSVFTHLCSIPISYLCVGSPCALSLASSSQNSL